MIEREKKGELTQEEVAYKICGTGFEALEINGRRDDTVSRILDQACDLELPEDYRSPSSSWSELVKLVYELVNQTG